MGRMAKEKNLILSEDEYYRAGQFIIEAREMLPDMNIQAADCFGYFGRLEERIRDGEWMGCMAGIGAMGIDSDSSVRGCLSLQDYPSEDSIREQSLESIWNKPLNFKYNRMFREVMKAKREAALNREKNKGSEEKNE